METDRVNRWLTLGANFGVVIGIALLILEINQNTEMMRAQMTQARAENLLDRYRDEIHSDYWAEILAKRRQAISIDEWVGSLTPAEYERVWTYQLFQWHRLQAQYSQYRSGADEITIADLTGVAVQDIQIAKAVWQLIN